jgi:uncharacterized protein
MGAIFQPLASYRADPPRRYRLLPFRYLRWSAEEVLVVNDVGEYVFLSAERFLALAAGSLAPECPEYLDLKARHFLADSGSDVPLDLLATKYRTKKGFLRGFTALHLFVVTLRCDHTCSYCQVSRVTEDRSLYDMSPETAERAVSLMLRSPAPLLKVEFQGGEPLLNFDTLRVVVEDVEERCAAAGRQAEFVVATNLSVLTDEMLRFFRIHRVNVSTSLDGPAFIHDAHRVRRGGQSHATAIRNIARVRDALGPNAVAALMTTSPLSLKHPREIVDEYVTRGFKEIFLRYVSPYGFAVRTGLAARYATDDFLGFYKEALGYIIELNRAGVALTEVYSQILLRRILTPFTTGYVDLQSPSGAGISVVAYNYDGDVYATDESRMLAEMGDHSFRLGNVHRDRYEDLLGGPVVRAVAMASVLETLPGCSECAFSPYCGADPVFHWATQKDPIGHRPTSAFCARQMGLFRHLFRRLREGDAFTQSLFARWAAAEPSQPEPPEVAA